MAKKELREKPRWRPSSELRKAFSILEYSHDTATHFLKIFDTERPRGAPPDEEMDLLRGMLVFTSAGLDSSIKQVIRDALPAIARRDEKAREKLEGFIVRRIRASSPKQSIEAADPSGLRFLGRLLASGSTQSEAITELGSYLVGGSLQSLDALSRAMEHLGLEPGGIPDVNDLREALRVRNEIVHNLDIDFDRAVRNRRTRAREEMVDYTNAVLSVTEHVIREANDKLKSLKESRGDGP